MTADPKVSPRPWIIRPRCDGALDIVNDSGCIAHVTRFESGKFITGGVSEANAAHIVRCVNAHDGLVEALEALSFTFAVEVTAAGHFSDLNMKLIEQARAALAAAKEGA